MVGPQTAVIVAHADDELIFFAPALPGAKLIVVTDSNWEGTGPAREEVLADVVKTFEVDEVVMLGFQDKPHHLSEHDRTALQAALVRHLDGIEVVYTHGPLGEYGHAQHKDIYQAVAALQPAFGYEMHLPCFQSPPHFQLTLRHNMLFEYRRLSDAYGLDMDIYPMPLAWGFIRLTRWARLYYEEKATPEELDLCFGWCEDYWGFEGSAYEKRRAETITAMVNKHFEEPGNIVDYGCHEGFLIERLLKTQGVVHGLERSPNAASRCGYTQVTEPGINNLEKIDGGCDTLVLSGILGSVDEHELREVIQTPTITGIVMSEDAGHLRSGVISDFQRMAREAGFELIDIAHVPGAVEPHDVLVHDGLGVNRIRLPYLMERPTAHIEVWRAKEVQ